MQQAGHTINQRVRQIFGLPIAPLGTNKKAHFDLQQKAHSKMDGWKVKSIKGWKNHTCKVSTQQLAALLYAVDENVGRGAQGAGWAMSKMYLGGEYSQEEGSHDKLEQYMLTQDQGRHGHKEGRRHE